jgi:hypothetical protein
MLVTQHLGGYNGILWDFMGKGWEMAEIPGFFMPVVGMRGLMSGPFQAVDKSVTFRIAFESMLKG